MALRVKKFESIYGAINNPGRALTVAETYNNPNAAQIAATPRTQPIPRYNQSVASVSPRPQGGMGMGSYGPGEQASRSNPLAEFGEFLQKNYIEPTMKDPAGSIAGAATDIAHGIVSTPERVLRSVLLEPLVGNATVADPRNAISTASDPNSGIREFLYGKDPVKSYQETARDAQIFAEDSKDPLLNSVAPAAPFIAPALAALDVAGVKGSQVASKGVTKAGKAIAEHEAQIRAMPGFNPERGSIQLPTGDTRPKVTLKGATAPKTTADYLDEQLRLVGTDTSSPEIKERFLAPLYQLADKVYGQNVDKARNFVGEKLEQAQSSKNPIVSRAANAPGSVFARFGKSDATRSALDRFQAIKTASGQVSRELQAKLSDGMTPESLDRIKMHLQDADFVKAKYGKDAKQIAFKDLTPEEQAVVTKLKTIRTTHNELNFQGGRINKEQYEFGKTGDHAARVYDFSEGSGHTPTGSRIFDTRLSKERVDADKLSDDVLDKNFDEITSTAIRNEVVMRNKAAIDALDSLSKDGMIRKSAPNKSFVQLDSRFGKYAGQYADRQVVKELTNREIFASPTAQSLRGLLDSYQQSIVGQADRLQKSFKTTLSPGTTIGNISSNIVLFGRGSGINAVTHAKNMVGAEKRIRAVQGGRFDSGVYAAQKAGLDIGQAKTGFEINGINDDNLATLTKNSKNPLAIAGRSYGRVDDAHKLAMFEELQKRGMSADQAAKRTNLFSQDYNNVGRTINLFADSPLLGKPFARFSVELLRLAKNTALYNPVGVAMGLGGFAIVNNKLSEMAGETPQEREARETQVGQTTLPGTAWINKAAGGPDRDISLNMPIGDSAVNIARAVGLNFPVEPGKDSSTALLEQLLPFPIPTRVDAQGNTVVNLPEMVSSLTLKPFAEQVANKDFMGRTITDRDNKTYIEGVGDKGKKFAGKPGNETDEIVARGEHLLAGLMPFFNETNAVASAVAGNKDYYGKQRTPVEAGLRTVGLKTESNNKDVREKRVETTAYFEGERAQVNKFLRDNPDLKESYATLTSNTRTRDTNTKTRDIISPERWSIIKGDTSGRLFNQLKAEAQYAAKNDKRPVDPIFELNSPERVKEVQELRSRPTGDDLEREEILRATTDWYSKFEQAERDYYAANDKHFAQFAATGDGPKQNPRVEAYSKVEHPQQTELVKAYYDLKAQDATAAKNFYKENADQLSADFAGYRDARLKEINAKRAIEGVSPIDPDTFNNVTFGYEEDEAKVARDLYFKGTGAGSGSYRRRGGGGGKKLAASNAFKYAVSLKAGGKVPTAEKTPKKISGKKKAKVTAKNTKPKVTIKKSLV